MNSFSAKYRFVDSFTLNPWQVPHRLEPVLETPEMRKMSVEKRKK